MTSRADILKVISGLPVVKLRNDRPEHWYEVPHLNVTYPSVTTCLKIIKDESITNWRLNRAMDYVYQNHGQFTVESVGEHLKAARNVSVVMLEEAGDVGKVVHALRERMFRGEPYLDEDEQQDVRVKSCTRALEKFLAESGYVPIASELCVYDEELQIAGALDDIGLLPRVTKPRQKHCAHEYIGDIADGSYQTCRLCKQQRRFELVMIDLKTSNQFKDHYWVQVALYVSMFEKMTRLKVRKAYILKVSKEDGTYKMEEITPLTVVKKLSRSIIAAWHSMETIKKFRKPERIVI